MIRDTSAQDRIVHHAPSRRKWVVMGAVGAAVLVALDLGRADGGEADRRGFVGQRVEPAHRFGETRHAGARHFGAGQSRRGGQSDAVHERGGHREFRRARRRQGREGSDSRRSRQSGIEEQARSGTGHVEQLAARRRALRHRQPPEDGGREEGVRSGQHRSPDRRARTRTQSARHAARRDSGNQRAARERCARESRDRRRARRRRHEAARRNARVRSEDQAPRARQGKISGRRSAASGRSVEDQVAGVGSGRPDARAAARQRSGQHAVC